LDKAYHKLIADASKLKTIVQDVIDQIEHDQSTVSNSELPKEIYDCMENMRRLMDENKLQMLK